MPYAVHRTLYSVERTNAGDPDRTLALLWRDAARPPGPGSRRGPRPGLSVDRVVDAAVALADEHGPAALTMRRVADALGVATMSLYTYVPAKAELLDLMLDHVLAAMPRADTGDRPWRERVRAVADENRALFDVHPWSASVADHRPSLGPGQMAKYEHELHAFDGTGLTDLDRDAALDHVLTFVRAHARAAQEARRAREESAVDDARWWAINEPLLRRVLDPDAYPLAARVGTAAGSAHGTAWHPERAWAFGLERVLDGLAVLVTDASGRP